MTLREALEKYNIVYLKNNSGADGTDYVVGRYEDNTIECRSLPLHRHDCIEYPHTIDIEDARSDGWEEYKDEG